MLSAGLRALEVRIDREALAEGFDFGLDLGFPGGVAVLAVLGQASDDREDPIFHKGDEVALMINGLGGTPISELYIVYGHVHEELEKRGIKVWRSYVGEYCTSLEMAGMSIR